MVSLYEVIEAMRKRAKRQEHYVVVHSGENQVALISVKVRRPGKNLIRRDMWKVNGKRASLFEASMALHEATKNYNLPKQILCDHPTKLGNSKTGRIFCADCSKSLN